MYELICNKHPLLLKGDDKKGYLNRLKKRTIDWNLNNNRLNSFSIDFFK
jgi:hypothetical protein